MNAVVNSSARPRHPLEAVEQVVAPTTLLEALQVLARDPEALILAGGTDLMPQSRAGRVRRARTLLNIRRVEGLGDARLDGGTLRLGTLFTVAGLLTHPLVAEHAPLLVPCADHFASDQIRNAATIGGNVNNASPAGDTLTPLLALDAEVELASLDAAGAVTTRRVALGDFITGPGRTTRAPGELLTAVCLPCHRGPRLDRFYKGGTRPALDISTISIALAARRGDRGQWLDVRLALGAVAATPIRARHAEALLEGNVPTAPLVTQAALCASEEASPIDDVRASAWYRRELVRNMTKRMLDDVCDA